MKRKATVLVIVLLVAVMAIPISAWSHGFKRGYGMGHGYGPGCGYGPGYGYGIGKGSCEGFNLNLTAEQSAKIQSLRETRLKEVTPLRNELFSKKAELRLLWVQKDPDKNKILAVQKEISNLQYLIKEKSVNYRLEVNKILTPEQRSKRLFSRSGKRSYPRAGICGNHYYGRGSIGWR